MSNKRASLKMNSPLSDFIDRGRPEEETIPQDDDKTLSQHTNIQTKQQEEEKEELKRATFYIRPDQDLTLDELQLQLKKQEIKTNKSELVRKAIDYLANQELNTLVSIIKSN